MAPRVLPADSPASIAEAVRLLRDGQLVAFPTETVYGLGALALDPVHVARIFEAKGRPSSHPLIAHVADVKSARALAKGGTLGDVGEALAARFFPGPLTLVVEKAAHVPLALTGGGSSVALRVPAHPAALALLEALGAPLAAPSANRFQSLSPTEASHVVRSLGDAVALVLDGGPCEAGIESTVVDVRASVPLPRVLRLGALSLEALRSVAKGAVFEPTSAASRDEQRASPGLDPKHYAPRARLRVVARSEVAAVVAGLLDEGARVAVLLVHDVALPSHVVREQLDASAEGYAHGLFSALHRLDAAEGEGEGEVDVIVAEDVPTLEAFAAVRDRLTRASST